MDEPVAEDLVYGEGGLYWKIGKLHEHRFTHKYGYYECRCRLQQKEGWWTAFWMQSPIIGASLDSRQTGTEIDIMESFCPGEIAQHCLHSGGYGPDHRSVPVGKNRKLDKTVFHWFGVYWDENGYIFYVDGDETGRTDKNPSDCPGFILLSTEVIGYREQGNQAKKEAFDAIGDTFVVDYVRVFDRIVNN